MMNISGCQYFRFFARDIYHGTIACQAVISGWVWWGMHSHVQTYLDLPRKNLFGLWVVWLY